MAARLNPAHDQRTRGRKSSGHFSKHARDFYVYGFSVAGKFVYIGKGSGRRFEAQIKNFSHIPQCIGGIIADFSRERSAYDKEAKMIALHKPTLNKVKGGGGSLKRIFAPKMPAAERAMYREMEKLGTRVYAARMLLRFDLRNHVDPSKLEMIRQVANGPRC
jgi:hypothetical protein